MAVEALTWRDYRAKAVHGARKVSAELEGRGVLVLIIGSLAKGGFQLGFDVDFVVAECPNRLKYAIEGIVEDCLDGIPFHVVYREEIPPSKLRRFMDGAICADEPHERR